MRNWLILLTAAALTALASPAAADGCRADSKTYFPNGEIDGYEDCFAAETLYDILEPTLLSRQNTPLRTWRLTFLYGDYAGRAIRIEEAPDGTGAAFLIEASESYKEASALYDWWEGMCEFREEGEVVQPYFDGYTCEDPPPRVPRPRMDIRGYFVGAADMKSLITLTGQSTICAPPGEEVIGFDGAIWLFEFSGAGQYCVTDRWEPRTFKHSPELVKLADYMAELARIWNLP